MSGSVDTTMRSGDPAILAPRWARVLRAAVLLAVGLAIAFTATFHEQFAFDFTVISAGLALIGCTHVIEWAQRRGKGGAPVALLLGIASVAAAVLVFTVRTELSLAIIVAAWALVSALLEFVGITVVPGSRQDAPIVGAAGVLLAITALLARNDIVAVIGFFGGYAVIAGVFLGIAAFDARRGATSDDSSAEALGGRAAQTSAAQDEM